MWWKQFYILAFVICGALRTYGQLNQNSFPEDLLFGASTASYQIEGGWNASGKGENIWDRYTHEQPEQIIDGSNGDIACDSYNKFREDVAAMKEMGVQIYRFSLSWSRILPTGFAYKINEDGIRYYNELIDLLLENDITPMVTLFHWDTPQPLQEIGGFANVLMVDWLEEYARVAFDNFGDRVKLWLTFNEPRLICLRSYGEGINAPAIKMSGIADYMCTHNLLKAHARIYHVYNDEYRADQNGKVSITIDTYWYEPASESEANVTAAQRMLDFTFGWFADPIFHPDGDYPQSMRDNVALRSAAEGFSRSRLPAFTDQEVEYIRGTYDFFGLNHYTTQMVADRTEDPIGDPSYTSDLCVNAYYDPSWPAAATPWLKVVPWGFRKILNYIKERYGDVDIHVTENGFADLGQLDDQGRIDYHKKYLSSMLEAIYEDNVTVKSYAVWSLLDNFSWKFGYLYRYGLYHIDFNDTERPRTPKSSASFMKQLIIDRKLPCDTDN